MFYLTKEMYKKYICNILFFLVWMTHKRKTINANLKYNEYVSHTNAHGWTHQLKLDA